jgi:hypothetical protein
MLSLHLSAARYRGRLYEDHTMTQAHEEPLVQFSPTSNLDVLRIDNEVSILLSDPGAPNLDRSGHPAVDTVHVGFADETGTSFGLILRYDHERQGWHVAQHPTIDKSAPEVALGFFPDPIQVDAVEAA